MSQLLRLLERHNHGVVGGVDGAGHAVDGVRHWDAAPQDRVVLDVVDTGCNDNYFQERS